MLRTTATRILLRVSPRTLVAARLPSASPSLWPAVTRTFTSTPRAWQETTTAAGRHASIVHGMASQSVEDILEADEPGAGISVHELVKNDHNSFRGLLWKYHLAHTSAEKVEVLRSLIQDMHIHSTAEELVVHPVLVHLANTLHTRKPSINMLHLQHESIKDAFLELNKMLSTLDITNDADRVEIEKVLSRGMRNLDEHMRIEEMDIVALAEAIPESDLLELGNVFEAVKSTATMAPSSGGRYEVAASIPSWGTPILHNLKAKITNLA